MRIGIDIDGVLTNLEQFSVDYFSKFCSDNNINYTIGKSSYNIYNTFNVTKEQEDLFWEKYILEYAKNENIRPFAAEVIQKLRDNGHEIYIITARWLTNREDSLGDNMRNIVKSWLKKNNVIYDEIIFTKSQNESKKQDINENNIDLMIEDNPNNINELSNIIPVICYNATYNTHCNNDNIFRCYSWYDIYNKINEITIK